MASKSIRQEITVRDSVLASVRTTDANGTGVDTRGYGAAEVLYIFGSSGDTLSASVKVEGKLEESDDNATFTPVAAADIDGTLPVVDNPAEDDQTYHVAYLGSKRYIRAVFDFTGTHTNVIETAAVVVLANPEYAPVE